MPTVPQEPVVVDGVEVRRWRAADTEALHALVLANLEHLRPWMPWVAAEPLSFADRCGLIETWMTAWDARDDFGFAVLDASGGELVGACGTHRRIGPGGLEVGYWVRGDRTRRGIASSAVRAVVRAVAAVDGIDRLEIHHDAANVASGRVAENAGFTRIGERADGVTAPGEVGIEVIWRLDLR